MITAARLHAAKFLALPTRQAARNYSAFSTTLVRPFGHSDPAILETDLKLLPDFYTLAETRQLLSAALWKLDKGDSTRRRQRRPLLASQTTAQADDSQPCLGDLFHGEYGFEPVGSALVVRADTM